MTTQRQSWTVVAACTAAMMVTGGPILVYTQSVFLAPMTEQFGWSRAEYFLPLAVAGLIGALATPLAGWAVDRWRVRRLLLIAVPLFAAVTAVIAVTRGSLMLYTVLMTGSFVLAAVHGPLLYSKIAATAGLQLGRPGLALALTGVGIGLGAIALPPLSVVLIDDYGWRLARITLGAVALLVAFPAVWLFIHDDRPAPQREGNSPTFGVSLAEAVRSRTFWLIAGALFVAAATLSAVLGNLMSIMTELHFTRDFAALMLSGFAIAQILGRFLAGIVFDRFDSSRLAACWFALAALGMWMIARNPSELATGLGILLVGLALGSELQIAGYYTVRFFGIRSYGQIYGILLALFTIGSTVGPFLLGRFRDEMQSYGDGLAMASVATCLPILVFMSLGRYVFPARRL